MNVFLYFNLCLLCFLFKPLYLTCKQIEPPELNLLQLLEVLHVSHDNTFQSIVEGTQKAWIRESGKERWEISDSWIDRRAELYPFLLKMGLFDSLAPKENHFSAAIIFGSTYKSVNERIGYLTEMWNQGIRFEKVILLAGDRALYSQEIHQLPQEFHQQSEAEMMEYLWKNLIYSTTLADLPWQTIKCPKQIDSNGQLRRPNTLETILELKKSYPNPEKFLFVSSQPHVAYQDAVIQMHGMPDWTHETIGQGIPKENFLDGRPPVSVCLDAIARTLYVLYH